MGDPLVERWNAWVALTFSLHGVDATPDMQTSVAKTLARLSRIASDVGCCSDEPNPEVAHA